LSQPASEPVFFDAEPTKDLFIRMLVRDIDLIPAIVDLVDNSVDGARRMREEDERYDGLWVRIEVGEQEFRIADNCGGIPLELAQRYAFRFGRPEGMTQTKHSVGQFGVGMKRALFKLGTHFRIETHTSAEAWVVEVDVERWRLDPNWRFEVSSHRRNGAKPEEAGTIIVVNPLHEGVARDFALDTFEPQLADEIRRKHQDGMNRGLAIALNQVPLSVDPLELLQSDELKPIFDQVTFEEPPPPVKVKIYAGLGPSNPQTAGWYVYCNGRLVLGPDQSAVTGWGTDLERRIPRFHNQFSRFRGYVFFDSDDAGRLPWTTTKTGVDANSEVYRNVKQRMVNLMRPVIDFLNVLDREKEVVPKEEERRESLEEAIAEADPVPLGDVQPSLHFAVPQRIVTRVASRPPTISIQYRRPRDQVEKVKKALGVNTAYKAGEGTFDYFYEAEIE